MGKKTRKRSCDSTLWICRRWKDPVWFSTLLFLPTEEKPEAFTYRHPGWGKWQTAPIRGGSQEGISSLLMNPEVAGGLISSTSPWRSSPKSAAGHDVRDDISRTDGGIWMPHLCFSESSLIYSVCWFVTISETWQGTCSRLCANDLQVTKCNISKLLIR